MTSTADLRTWCSNHYILCKRYCGIFRHVPLKFRNSQFEYELFQLCFGLDPSLMLRPSVCDTFESCHKDLPCSCTPLRFDHLQWIEKVLVLQIGQIQQRKINLLLHQIPILVQLLHMPTTIDPKHLLLRNPLFSLIISSA